MYAGPHHATRSRPTSRPRPSSAAPPSTRSALLATKQAPWPPDAAPAPLLGESRSSILHHPGGPAAAAAVQILAAGDLPP
eukprot:scaffold1093_cov359-Prasinococcus_capsulatus_cf.AAC.12